MQRNKPNENENQNIVDAEKKESKREVAKNIVQVKEFWKEKKRMVVDLDNSPSTSRTQELQNGSMKEQVDQNLVIDIAGPSMQFFIHENVVVPNLIVQVEALDTSIENFDDNNNKESDDVSSNAYEFVDGT